MSVKDKLFNFISDLGQADTRMMQKQFKISRQMVNRYMQSLVKEGKIIKTGRTKGSFYILKADNDSYLKQFSKIYETKMKIETITGDFLSKANIKKACNKNCFPILQFILYELITNINKHAKAEFIQIEMGIGALDIELTVIDSGIGILQSIKDKYHFDNESDALFHVNLPFSGFEFSDNEIVAEHLMTIIMMADQFSLQSHQSLMEKYDEYQSGVFECDFYKGTRIRFLISKNTKKKLAKFII